MKYNLTWYKQIVERKFLSFQSNLIFHTWCVIFRLGYSICVLSRQKCAYASIFSRHIVFL